MQFRLKPKTMSIQIPGAPGVVWTGKPMSASEETALAEKFQEFDTRSGAYVVKDNVGLLKARARRTITNFTGLPGEDGEIPFSPEALDDLCEMYAGTVNGVLAEFRRADALVVEATEKNS